MVSVDSNCPMAIEHDPPAMIRNDFWTPLGKCSPKTYRLHMGLERGNQNREMYDAGRLRFTDVRLPREDILG